MPLRLATIGVYGFTAETFLGALREGGVGCLWDVRRRRGVRGREYAWANARRLEAMLADAEIAYAHHPELATPAELSRLQYAADAKAGVGQRSREELSPEFRRRYEAEVLDQVDLEALAAELPRDTTTALLCVEREPAACHRSLIAARLAERHGARAAHLWP